MNLCRNGHDRDVVGRDASGQCRGCRGEQNRRRRKDKCRNGLHPKLGPGPCKPCRSAKRKRYRERLKREELQALDLVGEIGQGRWDG